MKLLFENWRKHLTELDDFDFSTFELKKELNPKVWDGEKLRPEVAKKLKEIVDDFWSDLDLKDVGIVDIIITGSAANYNWSEKSDIDLHILVNFNDIEAPMDLVKDYFRSVRANWNKVHNVKIGTHEVELYVQDTGEPHMSTGVYSLLYNEWQTKPTYREVTIDEPLVGKKAQAFMDLIEDVEDVFAAGRYEDAHNEAIRLRDRIRDFRKCGLEQGGEFSPENLAFKVLRRNGYLGRLSDVRTNAYDRMMSLNGGQPSGITIKIGDTTLQEKWSEKERAKRKNKCANPKGFTMKQFCKNQKTRSKKGERTNEEKNPRIPRKKGQPAKSKKHSDLYTDEDPKGTIHGLKFATVKDAEASVNKIKRSSRTHAHKVQAAVAMEQRAKAAGKKSAAAVYRKYINSVKKDK